MKHLRQAFCGALLLSAVTAIAPQPVAAQNGHWDSVCNCRRPDVLTHSRSIVRAAPRVLTHTRYIDHTRVVRGATRMIQDNHLVVHVQPVINREVVVHRTNTVVRDVVLHRVNTINRTQIVARREIVNRTIPGTVRHVVERHEVRGVNCNCGPGGVRSLEGEVVSYRD